METENRQKVIIRTSIIGIVANILIATIKLIIGLAASSLAIVSEGINNATDAGSSFLTLIGAKLAGKHPDEDHPFGYGRIEYLTGMIVGVLILYAGVSTVKESLEAIFHPEPMTITVLAIALVAASAVAKFVLGTYTIAKGKAAGSDALIAVGMDCRNDAFISGVTILTSVIFLLFHFSLDAYAGLIFAVLILKTGYETLKNTTSDLIGKSGEEELAKELYKEIRNTEGIISAADMMLHNYGPNRYSGSVNVEIDHNMNVGDVYEFLHALQLKIMHERHVVMVFGIYAVDRDSEKSKNMRKYIASYVRQKEHITSYHALYISEKTATIYVDFIVDYKLDDWDLVREEFTSYMKEAYPEYKLELTIETDFV